jgi:hypothetical protein
MNDNNNIYNNKNIFDDNDFGFRIKKIYDRRKSPQDSWEYQLIIEIESFEKERIYMWVDENKLSNYKDLVTK